MAYLLNGGTLDERAQAIAEPAHVASDEMICVLKGNPL